MVDETKPLAIKDRSVVLGIVVIVALVAAEIVLFDVFSQNGYYYGMLYSGILALGLCVALFLAGYIYKSTLPRIALTGSFCFGVVMLLGADLATPNSAFDIDKVGESSTVARVPLLAFTLAIIGVGIGASIWQSSSSKLHYRESQDGEEDPEVEEEEEREADGPQMPRPPRIEL